MERKKVADRKKMIYGLLEDPKVDTVVLHGEPGVGKTWIAKEVSNIAKRRGLINVVLWLYLNREYDSDTLRDSIAQQLSLLPIDGIFEVEEDDEVSTNKDEVLKPEALIKKLQKKKILLVLDDEGNKMDEITIRGLLDNLYKLNTETDKVLVTSRNEPTDLKDGRKVVRMEPLVRDESLSLLRERVFPELVDVNNLGANFLDKTKDMPNAIVMMAKTFKCCFSDKENRGAMLLKRTLEEPSDSEIYNITDLLRSGYNLVPYSLLIDCQREGNEKFYSDSRCINHNELIAYWMIEGYLGPVNCMETTYRKGHEILMELLDFQVLKRVEADYVTLNPLGKEFDEFLLRKASDYYRCGYYAKACLGLDSVFEGVDWKGLVRMSHKGGVMRTLPIGKKVSALLLDGNSLSKSLPSNKFLSSLKELQVLAIFNPTVDMLSPFSDDIIKLLHVFVLRSCRFMQNMDRVYGIKKYENLTVVEISGSSSETPGSSSLFNFPDDFFKRTPMLQSLNLSSLPITSLPDSLYDHEELKWLILRDCTWLTALKTLRKCKNLVVLDCSGSTSLEHIQDRSFSNPELRMINLSSTKMKILPLIGNLKKLTHLLLSNCSINRLSSIKKAISLEVIDLSNASGFFEFHDQSLETLVNLKILDLSGTQVRSVPVHVANPRHLCLDNCIQVQGKDFPECLGKVTDLERFVISNAGIQSLHPMSHLTNLRQLSVTRCFNLENIPDLSALQNMEELDFSGCKSIKSIPDNTFDKMSRLQKLNLSGTCIESLLSVANLSNLRYLLLKDCEELKILPVIGTESLEKLEEMDLCGCKALKNIDIHFFDGTVNLDILDLSEGQLDKLPSFARLINLRELRLRNCKGLKSVPDLEALTNLEILDLSGSGVSNLPDLSNFSMLRQLMLKNCSSLGKFRELGTLNGLGASVQILPYGISGLTTLERLDLPTMDNFQGDNSQETNKIEEKSDVCEWGISNLSAPNEMRPSLSVSGSQFLQPLERDPLLWETNLKKFHLAVYPIKKLDTKSVVHFHGDDFIYRDVYLKNKHIEESEDQRLLEIYGFSGYKPEGVDSIFSHANQLYFIDNKFQVTKEKQEIIKTLPSFLTACNSKEIKGFWIEKCREIEVIFSEKESENILDLLNSVETLWISNAMNLKSLFGELPKDAEVFQKLEKLTVEYCSTLSTVLSSSQLPHKLKALKIKFCDKLEKVFDTSEESKLQHLEILHLWELPEVKTIGCQFPSLVTLKISHCPNLENLEKLIESAENLQNLSISNVRDLNTIHVSKELKYLSIESCSNLVKIVISSQPPSELEIRIRFCNKLETVFEKGASSEIKLQKLHIHGLPKLKSIGAIVPNQIKQTVT